MREIKFRAWDDCIGKNGGFFYMLKPSDFLEFIDLKDYDDSEWPENIEQFTGLLDKNGKEIYDGDIVSFSEFDHRGVVQFSRGVYGVNWDYAKNQDPEWKEGRLYGGWGHQHNLRHLADDMLNDATVIGNIHENPELLA